MVKMVLKVTLDLLDLKVFKVFKVTVDLLVLKELQEKLVINMQLHQLQVIRWVILVILGLLLLHLIYHTQLVKKLSLLTMKQIIMML